MERTPFTASTASGDLVGWVTGDGARVLALHGGPGLGFEYLDDVVAEVAVRHRVATFQQRGLSPSVIEGEFTIAEAVGDMVAVLDALGWDTASVMGHSWGGHLAFHAAASIPDRLAGVLVVDPLGAVGDGGSAAFGAELVARLKDESRPGSTSSRPRRRPRACPSTRSSSSCDCFWPSYFADPATAPEMPQECGSARVEQGLWGDLVAVCRSSRPPCRPSACRGVLVGEGGPMPPMAGTDAAARIVEAGTYIMPGRARSCWIKEPGAVLAAIDRLVGVRVERVADNVFWIITDDQMRSTLRSMDKTWRRLARKGVRFRNGYSAMPLCGPARASMLTSRYPHNHGCDSNMTHQPFVAQGHDLDTASTRIKAVGYDTGYFGKYMNGVAQDPTYVAPGWDRWVTLLDGMIDDPRVNVDGTVRKVDSQRVFDWFAAGGCVGSSVATRTRHGSRSSRRPPRTGRTRRAPSTPTTSTALSGTHRRSTSAT